MENFYLKDLISAVNGSFVMGNKLLPVNEVGIDTRTIPQNSIFFAIKGKSLDGHDYIKEAIEKKVSAIVYSRDDINFNNLAKTLPSLVKVSNTSIALEQLATAYRKKFNMLKMVAITGSNGKTTTKEMLASILKQKGKTLSNQGNFNNRIGVPLTLFNLTSDTKYAAIEIGTSEFGEIKVLTDITKPYCGIITNIGKTHLEFFKTPENVLKEKITLIDGISNAGFVVLNNDDIYIKTVISQVKKRVITFGLNSYADVYANNIKLNLDKQIFDIHIGNKKETVAISMKGLHNVLNSLAATAAAYGLGFSLCEIKDGLSKCIPPKMRMQEYILNSGAILINDAYNANPTSMRESIKNLAQAYPNKEVILVLGDMLELGDKTEQYHAEIGRYINSLPYVKSVFLFGNLVRYIQKELIDKKTEYFDTKTNLCKQVTNEIKENSVIFIKGSRGMKLDTIFNDIITEDKIKRETK